MAMVQLGRYMGEFVFRMKLKRSQLHGTVHVKIVKSLNQGITMTVLQRGTEKAHATVVKQQLKHVRHAVQYSVISFVLTAFAVIKNCLENCPTHLKMSPHMCLLMMSTRRSTPSCLRMMRPCAGLASSGVTFVSLLPNLVLLNLAISARNPDITSNTSV